LELEFQAIRFLNFISSLFSQSVLTTDIIKTIFRRTPLIAADH